MYSLYLTPNDAERKFYFSSMEKPDIYPCAEYDYSANIFLSLRHSQNIQVQSPLTNLNNTYNCLKIK